MAQRLGSAEGRGPVGRDLLVTPVASLTTPSTNKL